MTRHLLRDDDLTPAEQAASRESLANPAALDYFVQLAASGH